MSGAKLDDKGRCCGRKPLVYKRPPQLFCCRCDRAYDPEDGEQIENWAWKKRGEDFVCQLSGRCAPRNEWIARCTKHAEH